MSDTCGIKLIVVTAGAQIELPPKVCILPKGHESFHTDGSAVWLNLHRKLEDWEKGAA